jgi:uncharacterized membrane protein YkvA (DUF1232 family)
VKTLLLALPRLVRMIAGLLADREVPTAVKVVLAAVAVYLASPVDLIPDVIPFVGYLDDVLLVAIVVDGLLNYVDRTFVERHWPASLAALDATAKVARRVAAWVPGRVKARIFDGRRGTA